MIGKQLKYKCSTTNEWIAHCRIARHQILLNKIKGRNYTHSNMDESQNDYTEWAKPGKVVNNMIL